MYIIIYVIIVYDILSLNKCMINMKVTVLNPNKSVLYTWDDPTEERVLYWNVYSKKSKGFVAKFEKEGFGQERVSFCQIKPPEAANNNLNLMKLITNQTLEPSDTSSAEDSDSDVPHPKVIYFLYFSILILQLININALI